MHAALECDLQIIEANERSRMLLTAPPWKNYSQEDVLQARNPRSFCSLPVNELFTEKVLPMKSMKHFIQLPYQWTIHQKMSQIKNRKHFLQLLFQPTIHQKKCCHWVVRNVFNNFPANKLFTKSCKTCKNSVSTDWCDATFMVGVSQCKLQLFARNTVLC